MYGHDNCLRKKTAVPGVGAARFLLLAFVLLVGCENSTKITENAKGRVSSYPIPETTPFLTFVAEAESDDGVQLEDPRSGRTVQINVSRRYKAASGRTCRLFQVTFPPGYEGRPDGLVCRDASGRWEISGLIVNPENLDAESRVPETQIAELAEPPPGSSEAGPEEMSAKEKTGAPTVQVQSDEPVVQEIAASGNGQAEEAEHPAKDVTMQLANATATGISEAQGAETPAFAAHLSSVRTRDGTETEWQNLQDLFPKLLDGKKLTVRTIEIAEKGTFYRVMAGLFDNHDEAQDLCSQLKASGQYCMVRRLSEDSDRQSGAATFDL